MNRATLATLVAALLWTGASAAAADPIIQTVEKHRNEAGEIDRRGNDFIHRPSGYVFPSALGDMPARKTVTYDHENSSVYYTLHGGGNGDAWLSLFVYRAHVPWNEEIATVKEALLRQTPNARVLRPSGLPPPPPGAADEWFESTFEGVPMINGYRLVRDGGWYIKVRLTIPKSGGQKALDRAWRALGAVRWAIPPLTALAPAV